jgi:cell division septation protein DedD
MGQDQGQVGASVADEQKTPEELRREIEDTRQDLGDTAAAIADKADVKARAKEKIDDLRQTVADKKESFTSSGPDGETPATGPKATAGSVATQAKAKAQEKPVATAAAAAFLGGYLLGRIRSR